METKLLLPHRCKTFGIIIAILGIILLILSDRFDFLLRIGNIDMALTISCALIIIGGMLIAFAKEKVEDEFISKLRLTSLLWAISINYILLLIGILTVYGLDFLNVLFYNMFTPLVIFIIRFNFLYYKYSRENEK